MSDRVTREDIEMISYFLVDRGDITRWVYWEERKPIITKEFPELIAAINALEIAENTLNRIARNIVDNAYKYPEG